MSAEFTLPRIVLYDANGVEMSVQNGVAIPAGTSSLLLAASDGTNARHLKSNITGRLDINLEAWLGAITPTIGQKTSAESIPVVLPSDQNVPVTATITKSTTGSVTAVVSSATVVTLLASNSSRLGATIYNDSSKVLYLKLGTAASTTSYTTQMLPGAYYEIPTSYSGIITGLWSAVNGNALVTELT